jgi:hypothetical protein
MKALSLATLRREVSHASSGREIRHMSRSRKWRSKESAANRHQERSASTSKMAEKTDYTAWSQTDLIKRVTQLENELKANNRRSIAIPVPRVGLC